MAGKTKDEEFAERLKKLHEGLTISEILNESSRRFDSTKVTYRIAGKLSDKSYAQFQKDLQKIRMKMKSEDPMSSLRSITAIVSLPEYESTIILFSNDASVLSSYSKRLEEVVRKYGLKMS
jgi:hypothetical protein